MAPASTSSSQSPNGHGQRHDHRVVGGGAPSALPPHPVIGMPLDHNSQALQSPELEHMHANQSSPVPKFDFPKFDGDNPRPWRDHCVLFFEVYGVHPAMRTRFTALNFQGSTANWLQTMERHERITDWDHLCELVFANMTRISTRSS
jgi:hypothetical protein